MISGIHLPREASLLYDQDFCNRIWAVRVRLVWLDLTDERYNINNYTDNLRLLIQQQLHMVDQVLL
jgi:hypothetical protein